MRYFPIFLDLENKPVLVVGGGEQAAQKVRLLLKTKARIFLVAEQIQSEISKLADAGHIVVWRREFRKADILGKTLVYAASKNEKLNRRVSLLARKLSIPVNVVDDPEYCSFITPAIVDRDPVTVAIGTEGAAPVLAREIKSQVEAWLPFNYGRLALFAKSLRNQLAEKICDGRQRRKVWEQLFSGGFRNQVLTNDLNSARQTFADTIRSCSDLNGRRYSVKSGTVSLVGCGPGDPDMLTLKAHQKLQSADVLVIDNLVNPAIVEYARRDAKRINVGKKPDQPSPSQNEINKILVEEAKAGNHVVRLKGGDPLVFGRAAEEIGALQAHNIQFEVVPGISAAHACAASIALPLTLRQRHRQFSILTGASVEGIPNYDWQALAKEGQAFAIYMGVRMAGTIRRNLLDASIAPEARVIIVENGTRSNEKVISTNIRHFEECLVAHGISGPAIIFVGLDWEEAGLEIPNSVLKYYPPNVIPFDSEARHDGQEFPIQVAR